MDDQRIRQRDRRQNEAMPDTPFKDCNGELVRECRRQTPDRRIGNIEAEWQSQAVHW